MAGLIAKKLSQMPIGASISVTYGDGGAHYTIASGVITDSDFSSSIEMLTSEGKTLVLDCAIVRSLEVLQAAEPAPVSAPAPTQADLAPMATPTPTPPQPQAKKYIPLYDQELSPAGVSCNDNEIKRLFDNLPKLEKKKLGSSYDSFKYGEKNTDRERMGKAAKSARNTFFAEYDRGFDWSPEACMFCGLLLYRVKLFDGEVFMMGGWLWEAALSAYKQKDHTSAGAFAAIALLEGDGTHEADLLIILADSCYYGKDGSAFAILQKRMPDRFPTLFHPMVTDLLAAKGIPVTVERLRKDDLSLVEYFYEGTAISQEIARWLPDQDAPEQRTVDQDAPPPAPVSPPKSGWINRIRWSDQTGEITAEGQVFPFHYNDIREKGFRETIQKYFSTNLDGNTHWVTFSERGGVAVEIASADPPLLLARQAAKRYRYQEAIDLCKQTAETNDLPEALRAMVEYAIWKYQSDRDTVSMRETLEFLQCHRAAYPRESKPYSLLGQAYYDLGDFGRALEFTQQAMNYVNANSKRRSALLTQHIRYSLRYYSETQSLALMKEARRNCNEWFRINQDPELKTDPNGQRYYPRVLRWRCHAECALGMLKEATADLDTLRTEFPQESGVEELERLIQEKSAALERPEPPEELPEPELPVPSEAPAPEPEPETPPETPVAVEPEAPAGGPETEEDEELLDVVPYEDRDGWNALRVTKPEVIQYALAVPGPNPIPVALAYLHAAAALNPAIGPVYHALSLAANDPMGTQDYSVAGLQSVLSEGDPDYSTLNDYAMAAAFLRASFLSGRGYDYGAKALRDSIAAAQELPALGQALDTLEEFRVTVGNSVDIYADYRNKGVKQLKEDLDQLTRQAGDLYTKFILTPPREGVQFQRLVETKRLLFAKDGYLAVMLRNILDNNQEALEEERERFAAEYLNRTGQFSAENLRADCIDGMIAEVWEQAGKKLETRRVNVLLQGDRRNNLRSNIRDILSVVCQWYALSAQSAGLTWRTQLGEETYQKLKPQLTNQLEELTASCAVQSEDPQRRMGLLLLSRTASELSARLNGSWQYGQEKYLYTEFLGSDNVLLGPDFQPDLSATFCALPEFNILARIRRHVSQPKLSFQEHLDRIYGPEKTGNNYGTAQRIMAFLRATGGADDVHEPENADRFLAQTEKQIHMKYKGFLETYALDRNRGRIMQSDDFCSTLEDTVRYWYALCLENKNFGFFAELLQQSENQIHVSAKKYEQQLNGHLDALVANNPQQFEPDPQIEEAIREQITSQNFIVAEDWMNKLRAGDFSMELRQPEALKYLERFWNSYPAAYKRVGDAGRPLSALLGRKTAHNKDEKGAQQLIDCWLSNGSPSNTAKIAQLLGLLGWKGVQVTPARLSADPKTELYDVRRESDTGAVRAPLHPIAAFGSGFDRDGMQVACLYGSYDCDRLYEKIRVLDSMPGTKLVLLDYALGGTDRRVLARKIKQRESGLRNVFLVIDRVLICHLADNYNENLINRILMAVGMPFSYCQPYVADSILTMPPEIFIGRKDELLRIERPDGVNLIYGGRQLGKSALFKKARSDVDNGEDQRAVLVDIYGCDRAAAARRLSTELVELDILPIGSETEDWDTLCDLLRRQLRNQEEVRYLLIMLDEADAFIADCSQVNYKPLVGLKDIQQTLPGHFKFVLAGLHNVVRFNREVALGRNAVITHLPSLKVTPFRTPEAQELLTEPLSYLGLSLPSKVTVSQILATVNYFPGLIQMYCQKLVESLRAADYAGYDMRTTPPYVITDDHIRRVMADKEFTNQIRDKFEATLKLDQDRDHNQSGFYYPIALLIAWMYYDEQDKLRAGYSAGDILRSARAVPLPSLMELEEPQIEALLQELQDLNILRSVSENTYLLASKNFRDLLGSYESILEKLSHVSGVAQ